VTCGDWLPCFPGLQINPRWASYSGEKTDTDLHTPSVDVIDGVPVESRVRAADSESELPSIDIVGLRAAYREMRRYYRH
jgi:hypothetical protein